MTFAAASSVCFTLSQRPVFRESMNIFCAVAIVLTLRNNKVLSGPRALVLNFDRFIRGRGWYAGW